MNCVVQNFTIGKLHTRQAVIDDNPPYQREAGVWSLEKRQLLIDSILNQYDLPKLYFHDLKTAVPPHPTSQWSVIDGKQRLDAILDYVRGGYGLRDSFELKDQRGNGPIPKEAKFTDLSDAWQQELLASEIQVCLVQHASEDDIEELFSRLNNGEPLVAAEERNAMGGKMVALFREVAQHKFFTDQLPFDNRRYRHYEVAAKLVQIEKSAQASSPVCDLKKRNLDALARDGKTLPDGDIKKLKKAVETQLNACVRIFAKDDPLLNKQSYPQINYLFVRRVRDLYGHPDLNNKINTFLNDFRVQRTQNLQLDESQRDPVLIEFGLLSQQGTNDKTSLEKRLEILVRHFLQANPDVEVKDAQRLFSQDERHALWILGGRACAECGTPLANLDDVHGDHRTQWSHGGKTLLTNGRCLCSSCNTSLAQQVPAAAGSAGAS